MCLIGVAVDVPGGPWLLVVAANRDEFHDRHTAPAARWDRDGRDGILAGRDLQGGGTWLGLRRRQSERSIRIAALTNLRPGLMPAPPVDLVRGPGAQPAVPPSRGRLVTAFLRADMAPAAFLGSLDPPAAAFAGFNLLALALHGVRGDGDTDAGAAGGAPAVDAWYLNNLPGAQPRRLRAGVHVVSNATVDVAWPKTELLQGALTRALHDTGGQRRPDPMRLCERLLDALADRTPAAERDLPRTGLDPARERLLSAPFIVDDHYGTRCSTVIVVSRSGEVTFCERSFGPAGRPLGTVVEHS